MRVRSIATTPSRPIAHTYAHPGTYHGTVTLSAGNAAPVTADFTAVWP